MNSVIIGSENDESSSIHVKTLRVKMADKKLLKMIWTFLLIWAIEFLHSTSSFAASKSYVKH